MKLLRFIPLLALLLAPLSLLAAPEGGPNSSKECSMCHFRWMDDFLEEEGRDYLLDFPKEKVVATEMMCYSCHDGSINDSRFKVWETGRHKSGVKPSEKVTVPEEYPLDAEGRMQCGTCHSAHGVDTRITMASAIFLREPNIGSSMCQRCHKGKDVGPKKGSHPIDVEFKDFPDEILQAGGKAYQGNKVICESCHTPHGSTSENFLIIPNSEANLTQSMLCETCHGVSPDLNSDKELRRHSHPVDMELIKEAKLPEQWDNGEKPYLGQGKMVNCRTCHSPHNGTADNHLLVQKDRRDSFCLTCHSSKRSIYKTRHDIGRFYPDDKNADGLKASEEGVCSACHFMHKGRGPKMWARESVKGSMEELCTGCHNRKGMAKKALTGNLTHPVNVELKQPLRSLPLFAKNGRRSSKGRVSCASCHDVHRWSPDSSAKGDPKIAGDGNNSFLRKSATKGRLCQTCHTGEAAIEKSKHDLNLAAPKQRNVKNQTLKQSGICGACHVAHNADNPKLWARKIGKGGALIERICNDCHKKGGMAEDKTTGKESHPLQRRASNMDPAMKDRLPLYTQQGDKSINGLISCATCHDIHRWEPKAKKGPGSLKIEGDRLTSFLRVPNGNSATLCAACHKKNTYVIGTDHDLRITAPKERNMEEQTTDEGGICSACHIVHNAWGNGLWSRSVGIGDNRNEARCNGCHKRRKSASKKALRGPSHPMNKRVSKAKPSLQRELSTFYSGDSEAKVKTELPLYTSGGVYSSDGDITCPTCHDPHVWDPQVEGPGPGKKLEGDGGNSFLRKSNLPDSGLCTTCHTQKAFVAGTDHDMALTAPQTTNRLKKTVAQSGVCSACHIPHGAQADYRLWGRNLGEGSDLKQEQLCLICHAKNRPAGKKVVAEFSHPREVIVTQVRRLESAEYAPVFDKDGNKVPAGLIVCSTCHEPHIWTVRKKGTGPGKVAEGNIKNSFLRFKSSKNVCRNCHGLDSLQKYKYFHSKRAR